MWVGSCLTCDMPHSDKLHFIRSLITSGLQLQKPQRVVATITGHVISMVSEWLRSDGCPCKVDLSLSSSQQLMTLVRGCLISKAYKFGLADSHVGHLSSLLLQAFLHVLPREPLDFYSFPAHVHVTCQSGCSLEQSAMLSGVAMVTNDRQFVGWMGGGQKCELLRGAEGREIPTAVFDVSLAGDSEEG